MARRQEVQLERGLLSLVVFDAAFERLDSLLVPAEPVVQRAAAVARAALADAGRAGVLRVIGGPPAGGAAPMTEVRDLALGLAEPVLRRSRPPASPTVPGQADDTRERRGTRAMPVGGHTAVTCSATNAIIRPSLAAPE
jgi:hypothetical protein